MAFMLKEELTMFLFTVAGWILFGWLWSKLELFQSKQVLGAKLTGTSEEESTTTTEAELEGILTRARCFLVSAATQCFPQLLQGPKEGRLVSRRVSFSQEVKEYDGASASEPARRRRRQEWNTLLESYGVLGASPGAWSSGPNGNLNSKALPDEAVFFPEAVEQDEAQEPWTLVNDDFEQEEGMRSRIRSDC